MKKLFFSILALCACAGTVGAAETVLLDETFASDCGEFTIENVEIPSGGSYVWCYSSSYMKASAYISGTPHAAESWLISPAIDTRNAASLTLTFDHAAKFQKGNWTDEFQLLVAKNPSSTFNAAEWTNVTIPTMPTSGSWTFVSSGDIDLSEYVGIENLRIAFRYLSTASAADTWEVKNVKLTADEYADGEAFYVYNTDGTIVGYKIAKVDSISFTRPGYSTFISTGSIDGHNYVDLGLPSGLKWATCNVGASQPEESGNYFAWGETSSKETYNWQTYDFTLGSASDAEQYDTNCAGKVTKYNVDADYGTVDNQTTIESADDAATQKWGGNWRMPTYYDWQELIDNCTWTWTTINRTKGYLVKAANGNSIFLPVTGVQVVNGHQSVNLGIYWSSSLYTDVPYCAWHLDFNSSNIYWSYYERVYGRAIRPVQGEIPQYSVIVNECENGVVSADKTSVQPGERVQLEISPKTGYVLQSISVMCGENEIVLSDDNVFYMPVGDIEISAVFVESVTTSTTKPLSGVFSVSANKTVKFAPGNLQCALSATDTVWAFAENQYDMLGKSNVSGSVLADKIDLFGWSSNNIKAPWGISTSKTNGYYSGEFVDWGKNIGDGNTWRTLTKEEWVFLFRTRNDAVNKYGAACIRLNNTDSVTGIIVLPDSWNCPSGVEFKSGMGSWYTPSDYAKKQVFELSQWQQLEAAGALFLPAAGYRPGSDVNNLHQNGSYWSSVVDDENSNNAYGFGFDGCDIATEDSHQRSWGQSVRLVQDANSKSEETITTSYSISVAENTNGMVTLSATTAKAGETVTLTIAPNSGYELQTLSVTSGGKEVAVTNNSFVMPEGKVEISAVFVESVTTPTTEPLSGVFSVSTNKTVKFAPGNLQYTQSTKTWAFAENQYDMLGTDNVTGGDISTDAIVGNGKGGTALADRIDLFGWSSNNIATSWGVSTSTSDDDYSGDFADWGKNIDDGSAWRTLTKEEWAYLLNARTNADNLKGIARINLNENGTQYVNGLILLPDDWICPDDLIFTSSTSNTYSVQAYADYQTFSLVQWQQLEIAGAIFLPTAGVRDGDGANVSNVQLNGRYWSASIDNANSAFRLTFDSRGVYANDYGNRHYGQSVRLVQDVK